MSRILALTLAGLFSVACQDSPTGTEQTQQASGTVATVDSEGFYVGPAPKASGGPAPQFSRAAGSGDVVLPAAFATKMGESNNTFPHAFANMRYQQVFLGSEIGGPRSFREVCLRFDDFFGGPAGVQRITLKLGPTNLDHTNIGANFGANYSAPPTTVFSGDLSIPVSTGGGNVNSFNICMQFSTIFNYAGGNLIVEMINTSAASLLHFEDFCLNATDCTTARVYAFNATAPAAQFVFRGQGLVMKLIGPPGQGCTPRFWRDNLKKWRPTGLDRRDGFDATFGVDYFEEDIALRKALRTRGRGRQRIARPGTAALLNAAHPDVSYPLSMAEVIAAVQTGERAEADRLAGFNELGCPFDAKKPPPEGSPSFTVNVTDDADDGVCDGTHCSLREAINAANTRVPAVI